MTAATRVIRCYEDFPAAFAERKAQLGISNRALEEMCGMAQGAVDKYLGPSRETGIGPVAMDEFMKALAVNFIMVPCPEKMAMLGSDLETRAESHVRRRGRVSKTAVSRVMAELSRRALAKKRVTGKLASIARMGGLARVAAMTPAQRKKLARKAAKARWARERSGAERIAA